MSGTGSSGCGDWCAVKGTFVWTFNGPPAGVPVAPHVKKPEQAWHQKHLGDSPFIYSSTFSSSPRHPLPSPLLFKQKQLWWIIHWGILPQFHKESGTRWRLTSPARRRPLGDSLSFRSASPTLLLLLFFLPHVFLLSEIQQFFQLRVWLLII